MTKASLIEHLSLPEVAKLLALSRVRLQLGEFRQPNNRRRDWYTFRDGNVSVFFTFSDPEYLWYGVRHKDLKEWMLYEKSYVVFVTLGRDKAGKAQEEVLIVPAQTLAEHIATERRRTATGGRYILHLNVQEGTYKFEELPRLELSQYLNNYEQLATQV